MVFQLLVQNSAETRNMKKMGKKSKKSATIAPPTKYPGPSKKRLISDTTCLGLGNTSWESIYNLIKVEEPEELSKEATTDSTNKSEGTLKELACSFLHRIAARAKILPFTDVVRWVVEKFQLQTEPFAQLTGGYSARFSLMI